MKRIHLNPMTRTTLRATLLFCAALLTLAVFTGCGKTDEAVTTTVAATQQPPLDEDYKEPTFPDMGIYVNYSPNSSLAGYVENGGTHRVDTSVVGKVKAIPNLGYRFVKWSDGSTNPVREDKDFTENKQYIAYFEYETLEMPIVCINTATGADVESKTEYIFGDISIFNSDKDDYVENMEMEIRGRGNYSWTSLAKKSYKIKLSEKQSLLGLGDGKSKKWVLLANMCDQSMLRNYLSLHLAGKMPSIEWSPDCMSVEVFLNGEYRGVYLLCEEIDANQNKVNVREDLTGAGTTDLEFLIQLSANASDPSFRVSGRTYQIHNDLSTDAAEAKSQKSYMSTYIKNAWTAVQSGDETEVAKYIDIDSMVDTYLVEEITKNLDAGWDSFYLYRQKGGKLTFGPVWDFDNALGNANEGTELYEYLYAAHNERDQSNPWFYTIIDQKWFRERVIQRWDEISDLRGKLSASVLSEAKKNYNSYCRNFDCWDLFGKSWNRETEQITSLKNYKEHYEFLAKWLDQRLEWLDGYYHGDEFLNNWSDDAGKRPDQQWPDWPDWPDQPDIPDQPESPDVPPIAEGVGNEAFKMLTTQHKQVKIDGDSSKTSHSGFNHDEGVHCLFDNDTLTKYCCSTGGGWWEPSVTTNVEITFKTDEAVAISGFAIITANDNEQWHGRNPEKIVLYGKGADGKYTVIFEGTDADIGLSDYNYTGYGAMVEGAAAYSEYKLVLTESHGTLQMSEFCLYSK